MDRLIFKIIGPPDTPYEGGEYILHMSLPDSYPMAPPELRMLTPSGRFDTNVKICTSFSSFHGESWSPAYTLTSLLVSMVSFLTQATANSGIGAATTTDQEKRRLAAASKAWNRTKGYTARFDEMVAAPAAGSPSTARGKPTKP